MAAKCPKCEFENTADSKFCKECGTQLGPSEGLQVSKTMTLETPAEGLTRGMFFAGRYEIIEELGAGGMGRVYRAYDKKIEEEVALKLIRPEVAAERRTVERFRNEIKTARKIRHKNVCGMHDLGEEGKTLFITMEYVRGEDLKSLMRRTRILSVSTAIAIARQVAEGLGEAHRLAVVHRDLKPGNIMIDQDGNAKIMDFGIARMLAVTGTTAEGTMIGTPEYMSPEQVEGKPADARSDLYSLGVILFEMVTGQAPFQGDTPLSIAHKHRYEAPPDPQKLNAHVPVGLNRTILCLLEKDRKKRYQTTEELISELTAAEEALPVPERIASKRRPSISREITVKFRPKKLLIPAALLLIIVAIAIVLLKFLPRKQAPISPSGPPSIAILYFKNNTGDQSLDIWREGLSTMLITKLSQSRYFRVLDQSQLYSILKRLNLLEQDSFTPEEIKEIAARGLATHIVRGSLSKAGERFRIDLSLQNASTLEIIAPESEDGTGEESIFPIVDGLAERLKTNLGITAQQAATDITRDIRDVYTNSVEAYKFYIQGSQLMLTAPMDPSIISYFEKAVAADPQFAMAYLMLAVNFSYRYQVKECVLNIRKAFDLKEQVSEREKYLIEAMYFHYTSEGTWNKAIDAYTKLIALYPWDLFGNYQLGYLYTLMDEWDKAIERFEVSRHYKDENASVYHQLAWSYLANGRADNAREVLEGYLNTIADNNIIRANLGMVYCILGDFDRARVEIEKAYDRPPGRDDPYYKLFYLQLRRDFAAIDLFVKEWAKIEATGGLPIIGQMATAFASQGKISEAKASFSRELEKWRGIFDLFYFENRYAALLEKTGDFSEALSICERLTKSVREVGTEGAEWAALYRRGIILARLDRLEEAERTAEELRWAIENGSVKKRIRYHKGLLGFISLKKKDASIALAHLQVALSLAPIEGVYGDNISEWLDFQADAYELSGRWEEAKKSYEKIQSIKIPNLWAPNALILARSYHKLGKVLERLGDKAGAMKNYRQFLEFWKDADRGTPEVEYAKARLDSLK